MAPSANSSDEESLSSDNNETKVGPNTEEFKDPNKSSTSSSSSGLYTDSINFDRSSMRCFKEIELSSSSIFRHPLYFFPELEDPGIMEAFKYEPPLEIDNDIGCERYLRLCKELEIVPFHRILQGLDKDFLDLRYFGLRNKELRALFCVLEVNAYVGTLLLQDTFMEVENIQQMSDMLSQNTTLTNLSLKHCQIGPDGAKALNEGIKASISLKTLDLSFNSLGDEGILNLSSALMKNASLLEINLGHNNITYVSANILQKFLSQHECIEKVNLEWNLLANDEAIKKICAGLKANKNLLALNLSWNGLESFKVARELGRFIKESTILKFIDLSNNNFKGKPSMVLKKAIGVSESLQHVNFGCNPLSTEEALAFGNMLLQSQSLEKLDMNNIIFPKGINMVLKKLKNVNKELIIGGILRNFVIQGPNVQHVLLKRCHYLGLAPKKKKARRDFGTIILSAPEKIMDRQDFEHFVRKKKKGRMFDKDLLSELQTYFPSGKKKIDIEKLIVEYMQLYPETKPPPAKKKKDKKRKGKKARKLFSTTSSEATTATTTDDETKESTTDIETELTSTRSFSSRTETSDGDTARSASEMLKSKSRVVPVSAEETTDEQETLTEEERIGGDTAKSTVRIKEDVEEHIIDK